MQAIFAACFSFRDAFWRGLWLICGDKPDFACRMIMGANFNKVAAITLANRDKKSGVSFFVDEARRVIGVMYVFGENRIGTLTVVALHPEHSRIVFGPLQAARAFCYARATRGAVHRLYKNLVIFRACGIDTVSEPALVITMGDAPEVKISGMVFRQSFGIQNSLGRSACGLRLCVNRNAFIKPMLVANAISVVIGG